MDSKLSAKFVRLIFTASFGISFLLMLGLIFTNAVEWWMGAALSLILIILAWIFIPRMQKQNKPIVWLLIPAMVNGVVLIPEFSLRLAEFHYESGIQFGFPRPDEFMYCLPDPELFWKLKPGLNVNSLGFPDKEFVIPKPPHTFRIMFLGDSCVMEGYPRLIEMYLKSKMVGNPLKVECVNLAVAGYTTHQGVVLAKKYHELLEPDLVLVSFGWNDHWLAFGSIDRDKVMPKPNRISRIYQAINHASRLLQFMKKMMVTVHLSEPELPLDQNRVPPDQYRENISEITGIFNRTGVPVVLITPPSGQKEIGVPDYLLEKAYAKDKNTIIETHQAYNRILREFAGQKNIYILDLEQEFDSLKSVKQFFYEDGIHFNETGLKVLSRRIGDYIAGNFIFKPKDLPPETR